jgi:hypothetical protein
MEYTTEMKTEIKQTDDINKFMNFEQRDGLIIYT